MFFKVQGAIKCNSLLGLKRKVQKEAWTFSCEVHSIKVIHKEEIA